MQFAMAFKIIGVLLILFSTTMLPSLFLGLVANGSELLLRRALPRRYWPGSPGCHQGI